MKTEIKSPEEMFKENGFTNDMMIPNHLVFMLMHKYHNQFILTDEEINDLLQIKKWDGLISESQLNSMVNSVKLYRDKLKSA